MALLLSITPDQLSYHQGDVLTATLDVSLIGLPGISPTPPLLGAMVRTRDTQKLGVGLPHGVVYCTSEPITALIGLV